MSGPVLDSIVWAVALTVMVGLICVACVKIMKN